MRDIHALSMDGEPVAEILLAEPFDEHTPAISPDGQWMAYQSDESGTSEIYLRPFPGVHEGRLKISPAGATKPVSSPDSQELFYISAAGLTMVTISGDTPLAVGTPEVLFPVAGQYLAARGRRANS